MEKDDVVTKTVKVSVFDRCVGGLAVLYAAENAVIAYPARKETITEMTNSVEAGATSGMALIPLSMMFAYVAASRLSSLVRPYLAGNLRVVEKRSDKPSGPDFPA